MESFVFAAVGALVAIAAFVIGAVLGRRRAYRSYLVSTYAGASTLIIALNSFRKGDGESGAKLLKGHIDALLGVWDARDKFATSLVPTNLDLSAVETVIEKYRRGEVGG